MIIIKKYKFRKLIIKNYIAFYRINEDEKTVNVERILYGGTDWKEEIKWRRIGGKRDRTAKVENNNVELVKYS